MDEETILSKGQLSARDVEEALSLIQGKNSPADMVQYLAFGVLARRSAESSPGRWFPVATDVDLPVHAQTKKMLNSQVAGSQTLVHLSSRDFIGWDTIQGQIHSLTNSGQRVDLVLKEALGQQFRRMTSGNLGYHLVIIVNGTVRALPKITASTDKTIQLIDVFE